MTSHVRSIHIFSGSTTDLCLHTPNSPRERSSKKRNIRVNSSRVGNIQQARDEDGLRHRVDGYPEAAERSQECERVLGGGTVESGDGVAEGSDLAAGGGDGRLDACDVGDAGLDGGDFLGRLVHGLAPGDGLAGQGGAEESEDCEGGEVHFG